MVKSHDQPRKLPKGVSNSSRGRLIRRVTFSDSEAGVIFPGAASGLKFAERMLFKSGLFSHVEA